MKTRLTFILCIACFMAILPVSASKYYLYTGATNPWGTKGDGTVTQVTDITATLNGYLANDVIWMASGTYTISAVITPKAGMQIYGGFSGTETALTDRTHSDADGNGVVEPWEFTNATIITGTGFSGTAVSYPVITDAGSTNYTLNGISIDGHNTTNAAGGAIYTNSRPTISNCIIRNISLTGSGYGGAGIYSNAQGGATITGCLFETCVSSNSYAGGAIYAYCKITVKQSVIRNNYAAVRGGGIYLGSNSDKNNTTNILNNSIYNNTAGSQGGAIFVATNEGAGPLNLVNNTIVNNVACTTSGGSTGGIIGMYLGTAGTPGTLQKYYNNVIYNNYQNSTLTVGNIRGGQINVTIDLQYCAYNGGTYLATGSSWATTGDISNLSTPNFVQPSTTKGYTATIPDDVKHANFALKSSSGLKDVGTPSSFSTFATDIPTVDLLGNTRPGTNTVDMGAYEYLLYRSKATGYWENLGTWESGDNTTWNNPAVIPSFAAGAVSILNGHTITISSKAMSPTLTINSGAMLTLNSGYTLSITGNLNINSDGTNGTASFVDATTNGGLTVSGTTSVQQYLSSSRNWYMCSPVSGATQLPTVDSGTLTFYSYPESNGSQTTGANGYAAGAVWNTVSSGQFSTGTGYIIKPGATTSTVTFAGTGLNSGNQTISGLTYTSANPKHGFNLIGNPYPSYLNVMPSINANSSLEPTVWYRTRDNSNLYHCETVNTTSGFGTNASNTGRVTGYIPPMQGFWVRTTSAAIGNPQSITLSNANRSHTKTDVSMPGYPNTPTIPLKAPETKNQVYTVLGLNVSNGTTSDETIVMFTPEASSGLDAYDSGKMSNGSASIPELFTLANNTELAINTMSDIPYDTDIALGFTTGKTGSFSISASLITNFVEGTQILLKDKIDPQNPVITDLTSTSYNFNSEITTGNTSRFALIFHTLLSTDMHPSSTDNIWISTYNGQIVLNGNSTAAGMLEVFNSVGQKIHSMNITKTNAELTNVFAPGVYMVTLTTSGKRITKKVIID